VCRWIRHLGKVVDEEIRFDTKTSLTLLHLHRRTVERLREEAQTEQKDRETLERELNARLDLIEARLNGTPEPGSDAACD
jgi:predicted RNase H-like nuclease (RuvC/YqgF family)